MESHCEECSAAVEVFGWPCPFYWTTKVLGILLAIDTNRANQGSRADVGDSGAPHRRSHKPSGADMDSIKKLNGEKLMETTAYCSSLLGLVLLLSACASTPTATTPTTATTHQGPRIIVLSGTQVSEETHGKFISWGCRDYADSGRILVELGRFLDPELNLLGFVLYDGGDSGSGTNYHRTGINHRWDWGGPNGSDYAFIIKPDGTGLYYDFSNVSKGTETKANDV